MPWRVLTISLRSLLGNRASLRLEIHILNTNLCTWKKPENFNDQKLNLGCPSSWLCNCRYRNSWLCWFKGKLANVFLKWLLMSLCSLSVNHLVKTQCKHFRKPKYMLRWKLSLLSYICILQQGGMVNFLGVIFNPIHLWQKLGIRREIVLHKFN